MNFSFDVVYHHKQGPVILQIVYHRQADTPDLMDVRFASVWSELSEFDKTEYLM